MRTATGWTSCLLLLTACPSDPMGDGSTGGSDSTGSTGSATGSTATTPTTPSLDSSSGEASGSTTMQPTTATSTDTTTGVDTGDSSSSGGAGCGPIDLLFVIDNSGSMMDEQTRLLSAFPSFIADLQARLGTSDLHVMVTDVDGWVFAECDAPGGPCDLPPECLTPEGICNNAEPGCLLPCTYQFVCDSAGYICDGVPHEACDEVLGAGVDQTWGTDSSNQACEFASGARYIDETEPDLVDAFECAAQVGTGSVANTERPMQSMVDALTDGTEAFACNTGFLRDEAQLVITFITDESDDTKMDSVGDPASWHLAVMNAKGGDAERVAVLGLFGDGDQPAPLCDPDPLNGGAETAPRLRGFLNLWGDQAVFGSVCAMSYEPAFAQLATLVQGNCDRG